jgi:hypothetical protein
VRSKPVTHRKDDAKRYLFQQVPNSTVVDRKPAGASRVLDSGSEEHGIDVFFAIGGQ